MAESDPGVAACRWCGEAHGPLCPWVRALEFGPLGNITRVEFVTFEGAGPARRAEQPPAEEDPRDYPRMT